MPDTALFRVCVVSSFWLSTTASCRSCDSVRIHRDFTSSRVYATYQSTDYIYLQSISVYLHHYGTQLCK